MRFNYYFQFTLAISAEPPHPLVSLNLSLTEGQQPTFQYLLWCRTLLITHMFMQLTISSGCTFTVHAYLYIWLWTLHFQKYEQVKSSSSHLRTGAFADLMEKWSRLPLTVLQATFKHVHQWQEKIKFVSSLGLLVITYCSIRRTVLKFKTISIIWCSAYSYKPMKQINKI